MSTHAGRPILYFLFLLVCAAAHADITGQQRAEAAGRSLIGLPAPGLIVTSIDGETIDLGNLYGKKAVYLKFWTTWCVPCRQQMPHFQRAFEAEGEDLAVIAINVGFNDSVADIERYRRQMGLSMPIVFDEDGHLAAAFNLRVTPQHIVIGKNGRVEYVGHLTDDALETALTAARAQPGHGNRMEANVRVAKEAKPLVVGNKVLVRDLHTIDGHTFRFAKPGFKGPTVLVFLSPWCESYLETSRPQVSANCRNAREQATTLAGSDQARWLGVASGLWASAEDLQKYRKDYKVTLPLTLDESGQLFREFRISQTPTILILDAQQTVTRRIEAADLASLPQILQSM